MINVKFYKFSKKANSTARPYAAAAEFGCLLKSGSGVISPELEIATASNVSQWNYCYIPDFSRYYYVNEWTYNNGEWIARLTLDVLASWKDYIGASTQYVTRSSADYDPYVTDTYYPCKTVSDIRKTILDGTALSDTMSGGGEHFLVSIINNDHTTSVGAVTQYVMSVSLLNKMKQALMTDNGWIGNVDTGTATAVEIAQSQVDINPFQYITACRWFPVDVPKYSGLVENLRCGWWAAPFDGYRYSGNTPTYSFSCTTPRHSLSTTRGEYLNNKGYASYMMDFAGFHFDLDANMVANSNNIRVDLTIDFISGQACCKVVGVAEGGLLEFVIGEQIQNISVNIPMASIAFSSDGWSSVPVVGGLLSMVSHGANAISAGMYGGDGPAAQAIANDHAISANLGMNQITSSFSAGSGGIAAIRSHPKPLLTSVFQFPAEEDRASVGRPLCRNRKIANIPGFIECDHVELAIPGTDQETTSVKSYMEGGFFYE